MVNIHRVFHSFHMIIAQWQTDRRRHSHSFKQRLFTGNLFWTWRKGQSVINEMLLQPVTKDHIWRGSIFMKCPDLANL